MNPHALRLRNVRTFDEIHLDLPEGLLAILGDNGAGKTTLIAAIDVALFGPEGRSLASWYPRGMGLDSLVIELVFEHAGETYRVRRSFSPKGRGTSKCELERRFSDGVWEPLSLESQSATDELIRKIIGLSRDTFRASSYLAQREAGRFCEATPSDRKAVLSEVVGLAEWGRWLERARTEKRACEMEIGEARAVLERADTELALRAEVLEERRRAEELLGVYEGELAETLASLAAARERHAEAVRRAERRAACEQAQKAAESALDDLRRRLAAREGELVQLDGRLAARTDLAARAEGLADLEQERESLRGALAAWQERQRLVADFEEATKRQVAHSEEAHRLEEQAAAVLEGIGREHCDRCGQVLGEEAARRAAKSYRDESNRHLEEAGALAVHRDELNRSLAEMPTEAPDADRLPMVYDLVRQAQEAASQLAALDEVAARRSAVEHELGEMRAELPARERGAAAALAALEALGPHDPQKEEHDRLYAKRLEQTESSLRTEIATGQRHLARYDERLERLAQVEAEANEKRERLDTLNRILEIRIGMERACSANGIPALILESVAIPQVEMEATRLLRILGGPATAVELRTLRETKTGALSDTLDIILQTESGEASYETFSGGERARIAFALRLALAQLLAARKGADTGLLILDEIDGLDAWGVAALIGVLEELQQSIPRIILVSHQAELRDAFPQSLLLENLDGRSRIVQASVPTIALEVT